MDFPPIEKMVRPSAEERTRYSLCGKAAKGAPEWPSTPTGDGYRLGSVDGRAMRGFAPALSCAGVFSVLRDFQGASSLHRKFDVYTIAHVRFCSGQHVSAS